MLAAELRLKDAGYGEKYLFVLDENQVEEEEDKEGQVCLSISCYSFKPSSSVLPKN